MPRRCIRRQPVLTDGTDSAKNDHRAVTDSALSNTKRCHDSQLSNAKCQRCSDPNDCTVNTSSQAGKKCSTYTEAFVQSSANVSKDPASSHNITNADQQHFSDDRPNTALGQRLLATFFAQPCVQLAHNLLRKYIVRISPDGKRLSGRIVETEAYVGIEDRASHSYGGRRTARNEAMYMPPGTSYVYNIYGIYTCINISSRGMWDSYQQ